MPCVRRLSGMSVVNAATSLLFWIGVVAHPTSALGQTATATLSGTVVDESGAVVPAVSVTILNVATGLQRGTTTKDQGSFTFVLLPPGRYTARAHRDGFAPVDVPDIVLNVNDQIALTLRLKVASVGDSVTVVAGLPRTNTSPAVSTVVDRQFVENLPLNGRSFPIALRTHAGSCLGKNSIQ